MKFCPECGGPVTRRVPPGEDRPRLVCDFCGRIHYRNPNMVVGCIPEQGDKILMCRRAIEPGYGAWTLPAGYLENEEPVDEAAARETFEETGAQVEVGDLFALITLLHAHQVYLMFRARLLDQNFGPTSESLEVRLMSQDEIPWDRIAFSSIRKTLEFYFQDRSQGRFQLHQDVIGSPPWRLPLPQA